MTPHGYTNTGDQTTQISGSTGVNVCLEPGSDHWDNGKKCVVVCRTEIQTRRKCEGQKAFVLIDLLKWQKLILGHDLLFYGVKQPAIVTECV